MDAGFNSGALYKLALELKDHAIIKLNKRNRKKPPEEFNSVLRLLSPQWLGPGSPFGQPWSPRAAP